MEKACAWTKYIDAQFLFYRVNIWGTRSHGNKVVFCTDFYTTKL